MESVFLNDLAVRVCTFRELNMSNWSLKDIPTSYTPSRLPTSFLYFLSTALNDFKRLNLKTIQEKSILYSMSYECLQFGSMCN